MVKVTPLTEERGSARNADSTWSLERWLARFEGSPARGSSLVSCSDAPPEPEVVCKAALPLACLDLVKELHFHGARRVELKKLHDSRSGALGC